MKRQRLEIGVLVLAVVALFTIIFARIDKTTKVAYSGVCAGLSGGGGCGPFYKNVTIDKLSKYRPWLIVGLGVIIIISLSFVIDSWMTKHETPAK